MDVQNIKLELIELLLQTEKESVLIQIKEILENNYSGNSLLTEEEYLMIDSRRSKFLEGNTETFSWEKVKNAARNS